MTEKSNPSASAPADEPAAFATEYCTKRCEGPEAAHLDQQALDNIRSLQRPGSPNILEKVAAMYLQSSPTLLVKIREAVETRKPELLYASAHSLKSSSANLGATNLAELCRQLETMGRENRIEGARAVLDCLAPEFRRVCRALSAEIGK